MTETIGLAVASEPSPQLWSDDRIRTWASNAATDAWQYRWYCEIMRRIRDDYESALADLRTRLAETEELNRLERIHAGTIITERNDLRAKLKAAQDSSVAIKWSDAK